MKIGIFTEYYNSTNYGGLLQAYALCKHLNRNGHDSFQIQYSKSNNIKRKSVKLLENLKCGDYIKTFKAVKNSISIRVCRFISYIIGANVKIKKRKISIMEFRNKIPHSNLVYNNETLINLTGYDAYITGSDQVWHNISIDRPLDSGYFLTFVKESFPKISYAASISLPSIPEGTEDVIYDALKGFSAISVREKNDKENLDIIMKGKDVQWVLDPTMLLTTADWMSLTEPGSIINEKYIFTYFLGDSKLQRKSVTKFAQKQKLKIVNIPYLLNNYRSCDKNFGDYQLTSVSPELWISLIRDAEYVFTDSFHGSVFSILFHKRFFAFKRDSDNNKSNMNSRLYSLFCLFGLENRLVSENIEPNDIIDKSDIDYGPVEDILVRERKKSIEFLARAIKGL